MKKTVEELREDIRDWLKAETQESPYTIYFDFLSTVNGILSIFLDQTRDDCPGCEGSGGWEAPKWGYECEDTMCEACQGTGKVGDWHPERLVVE